MSANPITSPADDAHSGFIGRRQALRVFYRRFAYRHMKNGVYYYGSGGLGKSWILHRIIEENKSDPLTIVSLIDFYETENHSIRGLQNSIRAALKAPQAFQAYDEAIVRLGQQMVSDQPFHPSALASQEARANKAFIACCQEAVLGRTIILLFDTFERVQQREVGTWLLFEFLPKVRSLIIVLAGRPIPAAARVPDNILCYELKGFTMEETQEYIRKIKPGVNPAVIPTIFRHTGGAPLLIDLIVQMPQRYQSEYLALLDRAEFASVKIQDEEVLKWGLLYEFSQEGDKKHEEKPNEKMLIWAMAYLWRRFDLDMLAAIKQNNVWRIPDNYDAIFQSLNLKNYLYVKDYPKQQSRLLHDEIQRMVKQLLLGKSIDPNKKLWIPLYRFIVDTYYPQAIQKAQPDLARQFQAERLGYQLDEEFLVGVGEYLRYHQQLETSRDFDFEELLWGEMREHLDSFADQGYETCLVRGKWLTERSLFSKAEIHYRQMLDRYETQKVKIMQSLGHVLMNQGNPQEAIKMFELSRALIDPDDQATLAYIENNLGQACRRTGQWEEALDHYGESFQAATLANDPAAETSVYINRGGLYSLQGKYKDSIEECNSAIEKLISLPVNRENILRKIKALMNLGTVHRHSKDFAQARTCYEASLDVAITYNNPGAASEVRQQLGINAYLEGRSLRRDSQDPEDLVRAIELQKQAWTYLTEALEEAHKADDRIAIGDGLNRLGKVYRDIYRLGTLSPERPLPPHFSELLKSLEDLALNFHMPFEIGYKGELVLKEDFAGLDWYGKAGRMFDVSALYAEEVNEYHRALESLTELARVLCERGFYNEVSAVLRRIERIKGYDYQPELFGAMSEIIAGDLAFNQGNYPSAYSYYVQAYAQMSQLSGYASYMLDDLLRDLDRWLHMLDKATCLRWLDDLKTAWKEQKVFRNRPDMLRLIERVRIERLRQDA